MVRDRDGSALGGIVYSSSRLMGSRTVVLFCDNEQCIDPDHPAPLLKEPLMSLLSVEHCPCPAEPPVDDRQRPRALDALIAGG